MYIYKHIHSYIYIYIYIYIGAAALLAQKKRKSSQPNDNYKVSLCNHWLLDGVCHFNDDCHFAHGEEEINEVCIYKHVYINIYEHLYIYVYMIYICI
jgi:hypothetical protein